MQSKAAKWSVVILGLVSPFKFDLKMFMTPSSHHVPEQADLDRGILGKVQGTGLAGHT